MDINQSKINRFTLLLNTVGITVNAVYAELIYTVAVKIHEGNIELKDLEDLHNGITDQKITKAQKLIEEKLKGDIPEDREQLIQELAQLFIGDVKI